MIVSFAASISLLFAQQGGTTLEAAYAQEGWSLEYPVLIGGFVDKYKVCLRSGFYRIEIRYGLRNSISQRYTALR